jgi:hypothetical protein
LPALKFAGARSFVGFEGAGFRFAEARDLPPKKTKNVGRKFIMNNSDGIKKPHPSQKT